MRTMRLHTALAPLVAGLFACSMSLCIAQTNQQISASQSFDNFRSADYERLLQASQVALEAGDYTDARQSASDALQIIKVNHGLLSGDQFLALQLLANSFVAQQDWQGLATHLAYFEWLLSKLATSELDAYISGTKILNGLYLSAAGDVHSPYNAHYLIASKQLNWRTVTLLEHRYGRDSVELAPWLYNIVLAHYYQSALTRRKGMTSYDYKSTRAELVSGWSLSKNESLQQSYGIGLELLERIRHSYQHSAVASPVTDALLQIYQADWELLFGQVEHATERYDAAYSELRNTSQDVQGLGRWMAQPVVIPQSALSVSIPQLPAQDLATVEFNAWSPVFPGAQQPVSPVSQHTGASSKFSARASFDLVVDAGELSPGRPVGSLPELRYKIDRLQIAATQPANELVLNQAASQIADLQFRPLLVDGEIIPRKNIQLKYVFSVETSSSMLSDAR